MTPQTIERYLKLWRRAQDHASTPNEREIAMRVCSKMEEQFPGIRVAAGLDTGHAGGGFTGATPRPEPEGPSPGPSTRRRRRDPGPPDAATKADWDAFVQSFADKLAQGAKVVLDRFGASAIVADSMEITTTYREPTRSRDGRLRIIVEISGEDLDYVLDQCEDNVAAARIAEEVGREVQAEFTVAVTTLLDE